MAKRRNVKSRKVDAEARMLDPVHDVTSDNRGMLSRALRLCPRF